MYIKKTGEGIYLMQPQHVEHIYYLIYYQVLKAQLSSNKGVKEKETCNCEWPHPFNYIYINKEGKQVLNFTCIREVKSFIFTYIYMVKYVINGRNY